MKVREVLPSTHDVEFPARRERARVLAMTAAETLVRGHSDRTIECMHLRGDHLYYSSSPRDPRSSTRGTIQRLELRSRRIETFAVFPSCVKEFGFDGSGVLYAMDRDEKRLYRQSEAQLVEVIATNVSNSIHFAVYGDYLAWGGTWSGANAVYVTKIEPFAPRSIASGFGALTSLRADEHGLVFTSNKSSRRTGSLFVAGWNDARATLLHDGMTHCKHAERIDKTVWFSAYYARPTRSGLFRIRASASPELVVAAFDPRGFRVEHDRVVCGEFSGEVVEYFLDGSTNQLATIGTSIAETVVTDDEVFVATHSGELHCVSRG